MAPANRLQALLDLSHKVSSSLDLSDVLEAFVGQAAELTGATAAELSFWDRDRDCLVMLVEHLQETVEITEDGGQIYRLSDFPATRHVLTVQEPVQIRVSKEDDDPAERQLLESRGHRALLMLPLLAQGETIGMMEIIDVEDREFDRHDVDFCQALCDVVGVAVRNAMLYAEMHELAARDKLTGLYNRRLFEEQFDAAVARSLRNGEELALLVVDLDGLKRINDLGGHPAGDEALKAVADALRRRRVRRDSSRRHPGGCDHRCGARAGGADRPRPLQLLGRRRASFGEPRLDLRSLPVGRHRGLPGQGRRRGTHPPRRRVADSGLDPLDA